MEASTIQLDAWSEVGVELPADQADAVARSGLVKVLIEAPPDRWRLVADSRIGVVFGPGWEVRVAPRLAIPKVMFLLAYAADASGWRATGPGFSVEEDLFASVASGFATQTERALALGPLRGYVSLDEQATTLRGRLRVGDQIARRAALPIPLEITYDDYTADIPENRMLRGATDVLVRLPLTPASVRKRLRRIQSELEDVGPTLPSPTVQAPVSSRLNARYRSALALAQLILRGTSITTEKGEVASASFIFDMNVVFEDFLSATLQRALQRSGGRVKLQHGQEHLDDERRIRLKPDITWWEGGRCRAVVDAKYKPLTDARFPNADAYQMLAYCTALGLDRGYLVYAKDAGQRDRTHTIRHSGLRVHVCAVDVEQPPAAVLEQVELLAARIRSEAAVGEANGAAA